MFLQTCDMSRDAASRGQCPDVWIKQLVGKKYSIWLHVKKSCHEEEINEGIVNI